MAEDLRAVGDCAIPQPLLTPVDMSADPDKAAALARTGMTTFYGQFGHAPGLIDKWMGFYQPVVNDSSSLPLRTKELCRLDRKSTRLNSSHSDLSRMPSSA